MNLGTGRWEADPPPRVRRLLRAEHRITRTGPYGFGTRASVGASDRTVARDYAEAQRLRAENAAWLNAEETPFTPLTVALMERALTFGVQERMTPAADQVLAAPSWKWLLHFFPVPYLSGLLTDARFVVAEYDVMSDRVQGNVMGDEVLFRKTDATHILDHFVLPAPEHRVTIRDSADAVELRGSHLIRTSWLDVVGLSKGRG